MLEPSICFLLDNKNRGKYFSSTFTARMSADLRTCSSFSSCQYKNEPTHVRIASQQSLGPRSSVNLEAGKCLLFIRVFSAHRPWRS